MPDRQQDPAELWLTGLDFIGKAVKQFGRDAKAEVKDEWAEVVDKVKPADPRKAKETESPSPRDELLFGLLSRGVEALESIAASLKGTPPSLAPSSWPYPHNTGPDIPLRG